MDIIQIQDLINMKFYHGTQIENLKLQPYINSRYGFTAFFGAAEKDLAIKYAFHNYKKNGHGYLYSFEVDQELPVVDFENRISHSSVFRNLVYKLQREKHQAILIKNIIDYPSEELAQYNTGTILIVFNLEIITNLKMIGKY